MTDNNSPTDSSFLPAPEEKLAPPALVRAKIDLIYPEDIPGIYRPILPANETDYPDVNNYHEFLHRLALRMNHGLLPKESDVANAMWEQIREDLLRPRLDSVITLEESNAIATVHNLISILHPPPPRNALADLTSLTSLPDLTEQERSELKCEADK